MKEHSKRNNIFFIPSSYCQEMNNIVQEEITKSDDDFINCTIPKESSQVSYFLYLFHKLNLSQGININRIKCRTQQ